MIFDMTSSTMDHHAYIACMRQYIRRIYTHEPENGKITVTFWTTEARFDCVYRYMQRSEVYDRIKLGQPLNLRGAFVKDFDISEVALTRRIKSIDASYTFFGGTVNFAHARFEGGVSFAHAAFSGGVSFAHAVFADGDVCFDSTNFGTGFVVFDNAQFGNGVLYFGGCTLWGNMRFCKTVMGGGDIRFIGASLGSLYFYRNLFPGHVDLRLRNIETLVVQDCVIEKTLRLDRYKGQAVTFDALSLLDTIVLGQINIDWHENRVQYAIDNALYQDFETQQTVREFTHAEKAAQYRILKENFRKIGRYLDEDNAYRAHMRHKTHTPRMYGIKLFGVVGGYGTRPLTILLAAIAAIFAFGIAYYYTMELPHVLPPFFESVYFSAITFLTIGYGEITPTTVLPAILSGIEGFCGLFLMSYFTVAVARKILR